MILREGVYKVLYARINPLPTLERSSLKIQSKTGVVAEVSDKLGDILIRSGWITLEETIPARKRGRKATSETSEG